MRSVGFFCFFKSIIVSRFYKCHFYTDCAESGATSSSQTGADAAAAPVAGVPGFPFSMPPPWLPMPPPPPFSEYESATVQTLVHQNLPSWFYTQSIMWVIMTYFTT